ncbi:MAG: RNA polymerase sigma factor [Planctomycetes bacterium]|nr:RNA polymerase sigma factor [Planctomycetota bacterium]
MSRPSIAAETDADAIRAALAGDRGAAEALVARHEKLLWLLLWRLTGSRVESEELFQEVWLAAWAALPRFRAESALSTWLVEIALNAVRRRARRTSRRADALDVEPPAPGDTDPARLLVADEAAQLVQRCLANLAPREREALVLHHLHGFPFAEVASLMGVAESTARKLAWDGLQRARDTAAKRTGGLR